MQEHVDKMQSKYVMTRGKCGKALTLEMVGLLRMSHMRGGSQKVVGPVAMAPIKPSRSPKNGRITATSVVTACHSATSFTQASTSVASCVGFAGICPIKQRECASTKLSQLYRDTPVSHYSVRKLEVQFRTRAVDALPPSTAGQNLMRLSHASTSGCFVTALVSAGNFEEHKECG